MSLRPLEIPINPGILLALKAAAKSDKATVAGWIRSLIVTELRKRGYDWKVTP